MIPALLRRDRDFRRFWGGQGVSLVGDQITFLGVPLVAVLILHAGPGEMGALTAVELLPYLLFSLHAGAWVDRHGRRRHVMIATDLGRALAIGSVPVAYAFDVLTLAQLFVVGFVVGTLSVFFHVSYNALFVSLVPREDYLQAQSILNGTRAFSFMAGPSLAGLLVELIKAPMALAVDALSFVGSALFLRSIHPEEPESDPGERGHLLAGARYITRSRIVRSQLGATAVINYFNFAFFALFVLYATRELHVAPGVLGVALGAGAVGGVIGSVVTGRISRAMGIGPAYILGCVIFPAPLLLVPLAGGHEWLILAALFAAEFGSGFGVMLLDITAGAIRAAVVPGRLQSRVSGAYLVVNYGVRPLGALTGGALGTLIGLRPALWIATSGALLGVLFLLPSPNRTLRELPDEPEDFDAPPAQAPSEEKDAVSLVS